MTVPSDVIRQAAFAVGRIVHEGTGMPVIGTVEITAQEGPVVGVIEDDGTCAVSGHLPLLFPEIATTPYTVHLTVRADSRQFIAGSAELAVTAAVPAGSDFDPAAGSPSPLVDLGTIRIPADPVTIGGRVVQAEDPTVAISGASVAIVRGGTTIGSGSADSEGWYRIKDAGNPSITVIKVLPGDEIECSAAGRKTATQPFVADFEKTVQERFIRLVRL